MRASVRMLARSAAGQQRDVVLEAFPRLAVAAAEGEPGEIRRGGRQSEAAGPALARALAGQVFEDARGLGQSADLGR